MLGVIVLTVGRGSETYIARHIDHLAPGHTAVCSLARCESPSWTPQAPVLELFTSNYRAFKIADRLVRLTTPTNVRTLHDLRLGFWLTRNRIRVVFCEYLQVAASVVDLCRRLKIPVVGHAHGYDVTAQVRQPAYADGYIQKLRLMDEIVVVSHDMMEKVLSFGIAADKSHVIPCGTVVSASTEARTHEQKVSYKALAVGSLIAKKGPILLLNTSDRFDRASRMWSCPSLAMASFVSQCVSFFWQQAWSAACTCSARFQTTK